MNVCSSPGRVFVRGVLLSKSSLVYTSLAVWSNMSGDCICVQPSKTACFKMNPTFNELWHKYAGLNIIQCGQSFLTSHHIQPHLKQRTVLKRLGAKIRHAPTLRKWLFREINECQSSLKEKKLGKKCVMTQSDLFARLKKC